MRQIRKTELLEAEALELLREEILDRARQSLLAFTLYSKPDYRVNWHHRILCQKLDQFSRREIKRLMVFMPPRNGKSELVSRRLPAFILGKDPDASIIATSYGADLASAMNRDVQRIIDSKSYQEIFDETRLSGDNVRTVASGSWLRNSDIFEVVGRRGVYRSAGVGGGITGMGAHFAVIDDPIKNQEEADGQVYRDKLWDWYTSTLYTRLEKDACVLLTVTRWHEDDLAGRLLALAKSDPSADQWEVVSFPAIRDTADNKMDPRKIGEALWPWKYPLDRLAKIRASVGSTVWNALFQQRPSAQQGSQLKRQWWKFYTVYPDHFDEIIQSWDLSFKDSDGSDFVVGQVWGKLGANKYLLDQVRDRMDFPATLAAVRSLTQKWPKAITKLIEDKANGPAVIASLKSNISGIIAVDPRSSKESRVAAVSPEIESGNVYLPSPSIAPWVNDLVEESAQFPKGAHDDQVDAMTQALIRFQSGASGEFSEDLIHRGSIAGGKHDSDDW